MLKRRTFLHGAGATACTSAQSASSGIMVRDGVLSCGALHVRCAVGRNGIRHVKREGDGATPAGVFWMRNVFYRPDRVPVPQTGLPVRPLSPADGWCDAPNDTRYNQLITLPDVGSQEELWRRDHLYDLFAIIGFNDAPVTAGAGSAIFLHVASPYWGSTLGCVAVSYHDLTRLLMTCSQDTQIDIL